MERQDLFSSLRKDIEEFKILVDGIQGMSQIPQGIKDLVDVKLGGMSNTLLRIYEISEKVESAQKIESSQEVVVESEKPQSLKPESSEVSSLSKEEQVEKEHSAPIVEKNQDALQVEEVVESPAEAEMKVVLLEEEVEPIQEETKKQKSINEQLSEGRKTVLDSNVTEKRVADFHRKLSLNDMLRMQREVFAGDKSKMNEAFAKMAQMSSYEEVEDFFKNELNANIEEGIAKEYLQSIKSK